MRKALAVLAMVLAAFSAACGDVDVPNHPDPLEHRGDETPAAAAPIDEVRLQADDVKFAPAELTVNAGVTTVLTLENLDDVEHDFQIDEIDVEVVEGETEPKEHNGGHAGDAGLSVHTEAEDTDSVTFVANDPGTYEFYCTISGHRDAGMVGMLIVE